MKLLHMMLLFVMSIATLHADSIKWDRIIIEKIVLSISDDDPAKVYVEDSAMIETLRHSEHIELIEKCSNADFILISADDTSHSTCKKPAIVFSFEEFKQNPRAVAVFFWQKGRPTIRFAEHRMHSFGINLTGELSKFICSKR